MNALSDIITTFANRKIAFAYGKFYYGEMAYMAFENLHFDTEDDLQEQIDMIKDFILDSITD
jgi:hypothetical protein